MSIVIVDYGSQYTQLIARRFRELACYCEIVSYDRVDCEKIKESYKGIVLSGGPNSVYEEDSPCIPEGLLELDLPILGICYGMQLLCHELGGRVSKSNNSEYGKAELLLESNNNLISDNMQQVWMSHGDYVEYLSDSYKVIAKTRDCPFAAIKHKEKDIYGIQFHPEVNHTVGGIDLLNRFSREICLIEEEWSTKEMISQSYDIIKDMVKENERVLIGVSGGVDSTVAATLLNDVIGDRLTAIFIDNGLLRENEREEVEVSLKSFLGDNLYVIDASEEFLNDLSGVADPEEKRKKIGNRFIRVFEREANRLQDKLGKHEYLAQGTIYPDVIESSTKDGKGHKIKSHHNVGGLPDDMDFKILEPLRMLFKDEVRSAGLFRGINESLIWRQPFPGPGLAVRCLGNITKDRLSKVRKADKIFTDLLEEHGLLRQKDGIGSAQSFAVLLPVKAVGVKGDGRSYEEVIALRSVQTEDFMTADWTKIPFDLLEEASSRIINEVSGISRVVYDITSKPPGTVEWE